MTTENKLIISGVLVVTAIIVAGYFYVNSLVSTIGHGKVQGHSGDSTALITASATKGKAPLTITFEGSSMIGQSHPVYLWDFGDGMSGRGGIISNTYEKPGTYKVTATAILDDGSTQTGTIEIIVTASG